MGSYVSKSMDDNLKKQQEFMQKQAQTQLERHLQMQSAMRERQMAMQIARSRDLFAWWASFYALASLGMLAGFKRRKNPAILSPLLPLTFIVGYMWDLSYGTKIDRMKVEANRIMDEDRLLLEMPHGLPTFNDIENARLKHE